ncbi:hypothetical protein DYB26_001899, partial [Aphanomyces astaci]
MGRPSKKLPKRGASTLGMERMVIGVDDMVLLPSVSENGILENLKARHGGDQIYTFIGHVLVCVNPYKWLDIYNENMMRYYAHKQRIDVVPHVFATAEETYRTMVRDEENQCVIISGESGAGKTEASKQIQNYIAGISGSGEGVDKVKRTFLESNPLLEAFGNAKTVRNNNSSRFGKYFELLFDAAGRPQGGHVTNYLLEKSRIVKPGKGERNFHIFYQLLAGLPDAARTSFGLSSKASDFQYLRASGCYTVDDLNDADEFHATMAAMQHVGIKKKQIELVVQMLAGILHLGNVNFEPVQVQNAEGSRVALNGATESSLDLACRHLGLTAPELSRAFCYKWLHTMAPQFATQMAMIQQKFKDWSMAQLQEHSKKLQVWAEQLKSQIQMLTVECTKQVELFRMALDPAAKVQYHSQAEELQKQLKELKAKLSRCAHQHKIMAFTINGRQTPPRHPTSFESAESMQNLLLKSTNQPNQQHIPMLETSLIQNTPVLELPVKDEHPPDKKIKLDPSPPPTSSSTTTSTTLAVKAEPSPPPPPPASSGTCMLPQMTNAEIRAHVQSLQQSHCASLTVAQLKKKLDPILKNMMEHKFGWVFSTPVDPVALGIPDYFHVIKRPMDFGTIKKKLEGNVYKHMYPFAADVRLTFGNAMTFNNEGEEVYSLASDMLKDFNCEMAKLEAEIGADEAAARAKDGACQLCGSEGLVFEPAILYCNGDCNSKIRRNNYYFCSPDNKFHCCVACHPGLPDTITKPADGGGPPYIKAELCRKKNDDVHEEPWVQCDSCNQWVHQICGLFSDKEKGSEFQCPTCLLQLDNRTVADKKVWTAKSLPRSKLSDYLERRVAKVLQAEDEAMKHDKLIIRQVSNIDKTLMVRDKMYHRYKDQAKYPSEHRFKSKCICMFQEIHGVSVLLFGMYVHEFDEQEAQCNSRRVYVSYLDSVNYLEPAYLRTKLYHEILIGYLEYVKQRGFHTAHIWACPPLKGDDYILYCHPETQKT